MKIKDTNDTVKDIKERILYYAGNNEQLTTSMTSLLNQHEMTREMAIKNTGKDLFFERQSKQTNQNITTMDHIITVDNLPSMTATVKEYTIKLADLIKYIADLHNSVNNSTTKTNHNTHGLHLLGPILDNKHSEFQTSINTNATSTNINTQRLTVVDKYNVTTTIYQLDVELMFTAKQETTTNITAEDFQQNKNAAINKLQTTVNFVEQQSLKIHRIIPTMTSKFEQKTLDRIAASMIEVDMVVNNSEQLMNKFKITTQPSPTVAIA